MRLYCFIFLAVVVFVYSEQKCIIQPSTTCTAPFNVTQYNGVNFDRSSNLAVYFRDQINYYLTDWTSNVVAVYNQCGNLVKVHTLSYAQYIDAYNDKLYITSSGSILTLYDLDFNQIKSVTLMKIQCVHYSQYFNKLFASIGENGNSLLATFDANINQLNSWSHPYYVGMTSYNENIYACTYKVIYVTNGNTGVITTAFGNSCDNNDSTYGLAIDKNGQFLYVSCYVSKQVNVLYLNGTKTGKFYKTMGSPMGLRINKLGQLVVAMQYTSGLQVIDI